MKFLQIEADVLSDFLCRQCSPQPRVSIERQECATFSKDKNRSVNLTCVVLQGEKEKKREKNLENIKTKFRMSFIRYLNYQTAQNSFLVYFHFPLGINDD